jgi:hypothetical protein
MRLTQNLWTHCTWKIGIESVLSFLTNSWYSIIKETPIISCYCVSCLRRCLPIDDAHPISHGFISVSPYVMQEIIEALLMQVDIYETCFYFQIAIYDGCHFLVPRGCKNMLSPKGPQPADVPSGCKWITATHKAHGWLPGASLCRS